jgi:hypothetical protein
VRRATVILGAVLLAACANPARRIDRIASSSGFTKQIVVGTRFRHVVFRNAVAASPDVLHVYIEGDGSPYRHPTVIAADPTSREPLMLRLMSEDPAPSIYLGRPCYLGLKADPDCKPDEWTARRFAPEVLDSMESVLRAEIVRSAASRVVIYGHSGGGTLAVLLAQRVDRVTRVVTIGPTLDIAAWCELHGYAPLAGSLNPTDLGPPRVGLQVLHLVGERDTNTPPSLVQAAARARGGETVRVMAGFDHNCCWRGVWHDILDKAGAP